MFKKGHKHSENWYKTIKGKPKQQHVKDAVSRAQKSRKHHPQEGFQKGHPVIEGTEYTRFKNGSIPWNKGKPFYQIRGVNHPLWKGNSEERKHLMAQIEYKIWRSNVFSRDNWTCQTCGRRGIYLEAHHIKSWQKYPELRFEVSNGVTLCKECHNLTKSNRRRT